VRRARKKLKFNFDGSDSGRNKFKRGYGGAYGGVWRSQAVDFVLVRLAVIWLQSP
jgi:hypothetical protein